MRTTLDLPADLLEASMKATGTRTKTSAVIVSLHKAVDADKIEHLRALRGKLPLKIDLHALRKPRS
jgi:Arc/MetJ family transcription regulator